jgi:hypothetical protein
MPVIPFISDTLPAMDAMLRRAKQAGVRFVIFFGMTLKDGRQKGVFPRAPARISTQTGVGYANIFPGNKWGAASMSITRRSRGVHLAAQMLAIPRRIARLVVRRRARTRTIG